MWLIKDQITLEELKKMALIKFGELVKAVVDVEKEVMAVDGDLHADEEALLIKNGSKQEDLWGINLYPEIAGDDWIEFDSMINVRPAQGNHSCSVDNPDVRKKIIAVVNKLVKK
ncbi:hypothetical protein HY408_00410 [Candidatus Gottesmanbacteria bacterium]|nr:hypothetical protein [Candidatus Gottesmanbacteria bacterium]